MTTRTMFDTLDVNQLPHGWDLLAGYVNGRTERHSYYDLKLRYPHAVIVGIDTENDPTNDDAQVLDIEAGDATPADAPAWFDEKIRRGIHRPTLYFSESLYTELVGRMGNRVWDGWIADWGNEDRPIYHNEVARQIADHGPHNENIDVSYVYDPTWNPTEGLVMDAEVAAEFKRIEAKLDELIDATGLRLPGIEGTILGALYERQADNKYYSRDEIILSIIRMLESQLEKNGSQ